MGKLLQSLNIDAASLPAVLPGRGSWDDIFRWVSPCLCTAVRILMAGCRVLACHVASVASVSPRPTDLTGLALCTVFSIKWHPSIALTLALALALKPLLHGDDACITFRQGGREPMTAMDVAAAARAAAQQRPHDRWAAEFANMSLHDHPQHMSR